MTKIKANTKKDEPKAKIIAKVLADESIRIEAEGTGGDLLFLICKVLERMAKSSGQSSEAMLMHVATGMAALDVIHEKKKAD